MIWYGGGEGIKVWRAVGGRDDRKEGKSRSVFLLVVVSYSSQCLIQFLLFSKAISWLFFFSTVGLNIEASVHETIGSVNGCPWIYLNQNIN